MLIPIIRRAVLIIKTVYYRTALRLRGVKIDIKLGEWAIGLDDALIIEEELRRYQQKGQIRVLEIGSGYSTVLISSVLKRYFPQYEFYSVEADPNWITTVQGWLKNCKCDQVKMLNEGYTGDSGQYDMARILEDIKGEFDLVLVDAPPDANGEDVRLKTCQTLLPRLKLKSTLLLHDTSRTDERFAFTVLSKQFRLSKLYNTNKGIAVFNYLEIKA